MGTDGNDSRGRDSVFVNKFAQAPNVYHFVMDDKWKKQIYKGMDSFFWRGYHAAPEREIMDFIAEALKHRFAQVSIIERAYIKKDEVDQYVIHDKIFNMCPMHPSKMGEPFKLKYSGE